MYIRKQKVRNKKLRRLLSNSWFNVYQKVEGQKQRPWRIISCDGFNVYQKVEGQKQKGSKNRPSTGFNVYQKVDGQKPSNSNNGTTGDDGEQPRASNQQAITIKNQNEIKSHNNYVPTIYNKYIIP